MTVCERCHQRFESYPEGCQFYSDGNHYHTDCLVAFLREEIDWLIKEKQEEERKKGI